MRIRHIWRRGWVGFLAIQRGAWAIRAIAQPLNQVLIPWSKGRLSVGS
ncbi:MAG: hypothetical protein HC822_20655 [Oscillochloris sp.]|nr:hypothetical protein [Oscillochloris sp.]